MKRTLIKKLIAVALTGILVLSLAACADNKEKGADSAPQEETTEAPEASAEEVAEEIAEEAAYQEAETAALLGGWEKAESPVITEEMKALVEKASANLAEAQYIPMAYLGSQVVAGTNHLLLCRTVSTVDSAAVETYMFVKVYEDLEGNAQITEVIDTGIETNIADLSGGWFQAESPEITDEIEELCSKAFEKLLGVDYKPVALLSTQVVAGMNYCILCESTIVYPGADTTYAFVYIYKDLEGNAEVLDIWNCDPDGSVTGATIAE